MFEKTRIDLLEQPNYEAMNKNIIYKTSELEKFFSKNRIKWSQFYESERMAIDHVMPNPASTVLDIGCGCGGLGIALMKRFGVTNYTGIEINDASSESAKKLNPRADIVCGDFLTLNHDSLNQDHYALVFSLSCIDWNMTFDEMLCKAWQMVKRGGYFVATFRITSEPGFSDINKSYQYINYSGKMEGEVAPYVVVNASKLMQDLVSLKPSKVFGYGYYGIPSITAVTPYQQLCFTAIAIQKGMETEDLRVELHLPDDIRMQMLQNTFNSKNDEFI